MLCLVTQSCPILFNPMNCILPGSSVHGDSPDKNTGVCCRVLLQGIFPIQGWNPGLPHSKQILYHLNHQGSPSNSRSSIKIWQNQAGSLSVAGGFGHSICSCPFSSVFPSVQVSTSVTPVLLLFLEVHPRHPHRTTTSNDFCCHCWKELWTSSGTGSLFVCLCMCVCSFLQHACLCAQSCLTFCNPWTVAHQAPLSMGLSRQEYWSGCLSSSRGSSYKDQICVSCIGMQILDRWATWEALGFPDTTKQFSATPAECYTIQLNSDTI